MSPLLAPAQEVRFRGTVVNRDGVPQRGCQVEFFRNQSDPRPELATFTDDYGNFFLSNPPHGPFRAKVSLGGRSDWINVSIDANGIQPPTLVVNW